MYSSFQGGSAKAVGPVRALEFDSSGTILWSGDDKVSCLQFSSLIQTRVPLNGKILGSAKDQNLRVHINSGDDVLVKYNRSHVTGCFIG